MGKLIDGGIDKREHVLGESGKPADRLMAFRALWERKAGLKRNQMHTALKASFEMREKNRKY